MSTLLQTLPATLPAMTRSAAPTTWETYAAGVIVWGGAALAAAWVARVAGVVGRHQSRPRLAPELTAPLWAGVAVLIGAFVLVPTLLGGPLVRMLGEGDLNSLLLMSCTYALGLLALFALHRSLAWNVLRTIGARGPMAVPAILAAFFAVLIILPLTNAATMLTQLGWHAFGVDRESTHALLQLMDRTEKTPAVLMLAIFNAAILAPLYEELLFRGHLQTALRGAVGTRSPWPAILITSLLFASIHQPWTIIPPIFVLSVAIGYAYERTGSFWVPLAVHVAFNTFSTGLFLLLARG